MQFFEKIRSSSPNSENPNSLTNPMNTSPIKENDRSYDSRESVGDREPQPAKTTNKKITKPEESVPQNTEEPLVEEASQLQKQETVNPEGAGEQEKKKKKKKVKKTEDKAVENAEDVTQQNAVVQEEKPKKTKKKAVETEANNRVAEDKKAENVETITSNANNTQSRAKSAKKTQKLEEAPIATPAVQKVVKEAVKTEKPQEAAANIVTDVKQQKTTKQEPENKRPQSKQENRGKNLQVAEPTASKSILVSALVSPVNQNGKAAAVNQKNVASATPKANETEPRYSKNTFHTQNDERPSAYSRGQSVNLQNGNPTLKKSPTQGELSTASSPKSKLGPIRSKIQTGLSDVRSASKKGDTSEANITLTTQKVKSPTNAATRPKTSEKLNTTHKSYILEKIDTPAHANSTHTDMKKKRTEKPRMRSFDATKTDKIKADDSFETRSKVWQIRKAEKLLEEEKKKNRKQLENCTFAPVTNQKMLPEELTNSTIYERAGEWSQKVKTKIAAKGEEIIEAAKKPEPKKPRVKSFNAPPEIRSTRVYVEGFTGPQFGVSKTVNVPTFSQDPLEFRGNLNDKVNEICTLYDNLSSHLKKKSVLNQSSKSNLKEKPKSRVDEVKSAAASRTSLVSHKERSVRVEPASAGSTVKGDEQRLASLRGILNMNSKEKKNQNATLKEDLKRADQEQNSETLPSEQENRVPQNSSQRVEIRNNRYVVVEDDNISAIEKNSNFDLSLNFDASTARQQLV